ncbi:ret finger protein-like 4B [Echinops telfairi]|uniref:Ret finger protein-like 4B n=3 Tax=Echinops telfairi TaxID=9371 RepID=A0AC55CQC6_ECHTE|nr:ret finger protein-like 4B [Echinops telfairi]XP_045141295.1 ret finger protein-like 4B [Echinops telfairi]XP_045141296.1 ret finger protein-like 4B [Echinops telfairi]
MAMNLQPEVTCPRCLDFFANTYLLPCTHSFCQRCIQTSLSLSGELVWVCPVCRAISQTNPFHGPQMMAVDAPGLPQGPFLEEGPFAFEEPLRFREGVTLDAATSHSLLVVSHDLMSVRCGKVFNHPAGDPGRFTEMPCVLSAPPFLYGPHYWEVEVGESRQWSLGVCLESVDRDETSTSDSAGFWVISMRSGGIYSSSSPDHEIPAWPGLHRVGIFLHVNKERVLFFDAVRKTLIHHEEDIHRGKEPLCAFFCPEEPREADFGTPLTVVYP